MEFEKRFNLQPSPEEIFEQHTGISKRDFTQYEYDLSTSPEDRIEVSVEHYRETSSLIISAPIVSISDLAHMAIPAASFVQHEQPDIIVGCDRGGRFFSLAVHNTISKQEETKIPTLDEDFNFARLSKSMSQDDFTNEIRRVIKRNVRKGGRQTTTINGNRPKLMFIDDWMYSGRTREMIHTALKELNLNDKVDVSFIVMCSTVADVPWEYDPDMVGVRYSRDGVVPTRSKSAAKARTSLYKEVTRLNKTS